MLLICIAGCNLECSCILDDIRMVEESVEIKEKKRVIKYILLIVLGLFSVITILFFSGEKLLADGWYYIPDSAIIIATILCLIWQGLLIIGVCVLLKRVKAHLSGWTKNITSVVTFIVTSFIVLFLTFNLLLYSAKFDEKAEQYDEHIALYIENYFVDLEFRFPRFMYEENWLFMRRLSDDEWDEAVKKYGNPDDYYK